MYNLYLLWISVHGSKDGMLLGKNVLSKSNISSVHLSKLGVNANIVLSSCSVGGYKKDEPNIAEWMQLSAGPERRVYAPAINFRADDLFCENVGQDVKENWKFIKSGKDYTANISYDESLGKSIRSSQL